MEIRRSHDGADGPVGRMGGPQEERRVTRSQTMAVGTFACPACDVPVSPAGPLAPAQLVACPYCGHVAAVRSFLSLDAPARPARVEVRVVHRRRISAARR